MKTPLSRGTPIDMDRMSGWLNDFSGYRHSITEQRIDRWIDQFNNDDKDLVARVLDCVDFITHEQMASAFQSTLNSIPGWDINEDSREGTWRFVAFSISAGESGDTMLHKFRIANRLNGRQYNDLFIYKRDLVKENLGSEDTVVFVDDFSGTGEQAYNAWTEIIEELLSGNPRVFLILIAASSRAEQRINEETGLNLVTNILLNEEDNIFSTSCRYFNRSEKNQIFDYCSRANRENPMGRGECGFVIVFAHTCPNNSIPILHVDHSNWHGLFRRYD